ncbi:solute carrier family 35 member F3 isoform X4 [Marmota monax]|uniref:solute carrier family 35 member F3 isoform X4 n=1 Tax=Marmota monax TaxID=9995 RepID=UPI0026F28C9E|nr:solute carrier family 35 member F3 isoform X4 [Marmota monax]
MSPETAGEERPREPLGPAEAQAPGGAEAGGRTSRRRWTCSRAQLHKTFWGVAVVLCVCASWAGSTQLAKLTFAKFDAPFTLTWFATNWNFLFFPLYYAGHVCKSTEKQSVKQRYRECCRFFGDNGLTLKVFFTKAAPFGVLWTLTNYLYLHAIKKINTTDVSVLFCCNKAFVFLLSWIVLRDRFMGVRIVAAILAIAGIVMMTYADGFHSHSVIGIALVVGSASMSALYKVLFKLLLGSAKFGEAALFLSILGVFNIIFITCIPILLYFTKVEYWSSFDDIPWGNLCGFSVLLLTFNIVLNFGIAVTYPTLMSLGIVLSVPVNAVVDHYTSQIVFNGVRVIAIIIIGLGFLLLLLPEEWDVWLIKLLTHLKGSVVFKQPNQQMGQGPEQTLLRGGHTVNQQVHEKMLTISSSQRNANQNHPKIPSHSSKIGSHYEVKQQQVLARMWGKGYTCSLLVGLQIGAANLESSMEISWKAGNGATI